MHEIKIYNARGVSKINYIDEDYINKLKQGLPNYNLLIIDSNIKAYENDLYQLCISKTSKVIELKGGELIKRVDSLFEMLNKIENLDIHPLDRTLVVGGGTIQDVSATCLGLIKRGTSWDFIPTTILAQCDSCIGSKTSINAFGSKNLYGLFNAPNNIYVINSIAITQTDEELFSGFGDALHYLFLDPKKEHDYIKSLIKEISDNGIKNTFKKPRKIIKLASHCHLIKKVYVEIDEFDQNERKLLNLGHSFGHALEKLYSLEMPHGIAVMHGIYMAYYLDNFINSGHMNIQNNSTTNLIKSLLMLINSKTSFKVKDVQKQISMNIDLYLNILKKDKKNHNNYYVLVSLSMNSCQLVELTKESLKLFLKELYIIL